MTKRYDVWAGGALIKEAVSASSAEKIAQNNVSRINCTGIWESPSDPALLLFEENDGAYFVEVVLHGEQPTYAG